MFLPHPLEEGRLGPAPLALIFSGSAPLFAGLEIIYALPTKLLAEDRAQFLQTIMHRAEAMRAGPFGFIMWEAQSIIIFDAFSGPLGGVFGVRIIIAETS